MQKTAPYLLLAVVVATALSLCLFSEDAQAKTYHMKLLAVSESAQGQRGSIADLYLETRPGTGRIFIDTFPLTRLDTQLSTRFAHDIACNFLDRDCTDTDFFYTIQSGSVIIGGPSAGAATAAITVAALDDLDIDETVTVTGTINSGGLIGSVGGLKEKITAASENSLTKVLIPLGTTYYQDRVAIRIVPEAGSGAGNETGNGNDSTTDIEDVNRTLEIDIPQLDGRINLIDYGDGLGIEVKEAANLADLMLELTGKDYRPAESEIQIDQDYLDTMDGISDSLCERTDDLLDQVHNKTSARYLRAINQSAKAQEADSNGFFYSRASFCFGANIALSEQILLEAELDAEEILSEIDKTRREILEFSDGFDENELHTLTDLEAYNIVNERIIEAEDYLKTAVSELEQNRSGFAIYNLAYGRERFLSAVSWSVFSGLDGEEFVLDSRTIILGCQQKLAEAEERYQYAQLIIPQGLADTRTELDRAYEDQLNERYRLCLFKASKAKAEADLIISAVGIEESNLGLYLDAKLGLIRQNIVDKQEKGMFPILGYSYYEYAQSLKESDPYSAMLYAEYSGELSNLDVYFPRRDQETAIGINIPYISPLILIFVFGALFGFSLAMLIISLTRKKPSEEDCVKIRVRNKK